MPHAIQNHVQHFKKELKETLNAGAKHTIWKALEAITQIATRTYVRVKKQHRKGVVDKSLTASTNKEPAQSNKKFQHIRSEIIDDATQQWIRTPVHLRSPLHFLQLSSHCINDTVYYASLDEVDNQEAPLVKAQTPAAQVVTQPQTTMPFSSNSNEYSFPSVLSLDHSYSFDLNTAACMYELRDDHFEAVDTMPTKSSTANTEATAASTNCDKPTNDAPSTARLSSDPPPLAFFPKVRKVRGPIVAKVPSEPPPLVPIGYPRRLPNKQS